MDTSTTILRNSTIEAQDKLGNYVRNGITVEVNGTRPERLHHYRRLVFNVIFDTLSSAYPIARKQIGESWKGLIDRFFSTYNCQNYQVWRMPKEFLNYIKNEEKELQLEMPYLMDLLLFEWIEIELYSEEDKEIEDHTKIGDWENDSLVLNPHHKILKLEYPVYTKNYELMGEKKGEYYLVVLRDLKELKVRFLELSPLFGPSIINLEKHQKNLLNSLLNQSKLFGTFKKEDLKIKSQNTFNLLVQKNLILGYTI